MGIDFGGRYKKTRELVDSESYRNLVEGILALEDKFEYLYDVDIRSGRYTLFVNGQTTYENIDLHYVEYEDFFEDSRRNIDDVVFPDDRDLARKVLSRDYIRNQLRHDRFAEYNSRVIVEGKPVWFKTRIAYKDNKKTNIIVGVFNLEDEMEALKRDENIRRELIDQMLGGESLYILNPVNEAFQVIYRNRFFTKEYDDKESFRKSFTKYVNSDVYEADREKMLRLASTSQILARLDNRKEFEETYRDISSGDPYWYKMRVVRVSDTELLMGFANIDKEYLDKAIHKRIEEEFFAMFAVDVDLKKIKVLKKIPTSTNVKVGDTLPYAETIQSIAARYDGETRAFFDQITDIEYVQNQLAKERRVSYTYRSRDEWITADAILISRNETGRVLSFALGFRLSDHLVVEREVLKERLQVALDNTREEARRREIEATNAKLRADGLAYVADHERNPSQFLDYFAKRILEVFNCDQVLLREKNGKRIVHNAPGVEDVPIEVCNKCPFSQYESDVYGADGIVILNDCSESVNGTHVHPDCLVKSSVMKRVYTEGKITGLLSLHYLKEKHVFTDTELEMLNTMASYIGIMIGRLEARRKLAEENVFTGFFLESYLSAYYVNLEDFTWTAYKRSDQLRDKYPVIEDYTKSLGRYIENEIHPDDRETASVLLDPEELRRKLHNKNSFSMILRKISEVPARVIRCEVVRGEDENHVAFGFLDITDTIVKQEEDEKKLRDALEKAQSASKAKTAFLNNMSHDIRTPMNAIIGFTNMAKRRSDDKDRMMDCLDKIQESGNVLLSLINSVLEVSRIESGEAVLEKQYGDVFYSFTNIDNTMRELAESKDINLEFTVGKVANRYVYVDMSRCMRIFVNVISNAIKYTPAGGSVKVSCEQIGEAENGIGQYCYTVSDNGIGMSEEFQKHVFDQFARERNATISGIQGTGLGMAVCKSYVDLMGGTIECRSKQGEGTTFTIILPFEIQDEMKYTDPFTGEVISVDEYSTVYQRIEFDGDMVLLVEDNELNREIAVEILEEEGLRTEEAENGLMAVEMVKEKGPDYYKLILMDIQMPVMNGYEATKVIRELYPEVHIPIVALSANAFVEDKLASKDAGMDGHVAKPIVLQDLLSTLKKFLKTKN